MAENDKEGLSVERVTRLCAVGCRIGRTREGWQGGQYRRG